MEAQKTRSVRCRRCNFTYKQEAHKFANSMPALQACPRCMDDVSERTWHDATEDPTQ